MKDFERLKIDSQGYTHGYYKTQKLKNNQTVGIFFLKDEMKRGTEYSVVLAIANKKKYIKQWLLGERDVLSDKETGKVGLEGLMWGKRQLIEFENSLYFNPGDTLCIYWTDNRRRNVYEYGLKKLGYIIGHRHNCKCLYKKKV